VTSGSDIGEFMKENGNEIKRRNDRNIGERGVRKKEKI